MHRCKKTANIEAFSIVLIKKCPPKFPMRTEAAARGATVDTGARSCPLAPPVYVALLQADPFIHV